MKKQPKIAALFNSMRAGLIPTGVLFLGLVVVQLFSVQLVYGFYGDAAVSGSTITTPFLVSPSVEATVGIPVRVQIPVIVLDTVVEKVGLLPDGSMGVPKRPRNTGWYMLGPKPGEEGSAVIAGHVNWYYGAKGAFERLATVKPGSIITVQDAKGVAISFVVRETRKYGAQADATDVFTSHDGKAHLNLITCVGVWNKRAKQYTERLVVFADKVER